MATTTSIQNKIDFNSRNLEESIEENDEKDIDEINNLTEKCQLWLENCNVSDNCSVVSDSDNSVLTESTTNSAMDSGFLFQSNEIVMGDQIISKTGNLNGPLVIKDNKNPKYDNVNIYKSRKVHVGDVTYINGPVTITNNSTYDERQLSIPYNDDLNASLIINRMNWLAQPALGEKEYLDAPAKYVIICHTATDEGFTIADNTLIVRLIQSFHIDSRKWKDIAYNFLIGSDGLAYEGRGWGVIGSHTRNYNSKSIGIAFIGCFLHHLPPPKSLKKAEELIAFGVKRGSIAEDYVLLAHCQCVSLESPGKKLFEEIQSWKHWDKSIAVPKSLFSDHDLIEEPPDKDVHSPNLP